MAITKDKMQRVLLGIAALVGENPELLPLLERLEHDYDRRVASETALARIKAKLEIEDE